MPSRRQPSRERICSVKPWFVGLGDQLPLFHQQLGLTAAGLVPAWQRCASVFPPLYRAKPDGAGQGMGIAFSMGDTVTQCIQVSGGDGGLSRGSEAFPKAPGAVRPFAGPCPRGLPWEKAKLTSIPWDRGGNHCLCVSGAAFPTKIQGRSRGTMQGGGRGAGVLAVWVPPSQWLRQR